MNKLTVFFIIVAVSVALVVGTLLTLRYLEKNTPLVIDEPVIMQEDTEEVIANIPALPETESPVSGTINKEILSAAGFNDPDTVSFVFNGTIFSNFDLSEYKNNNHIFYKLSEAGENAGEITELIFDSEDITITVYDLLKQRMQDSGNFVINETNQYGNASFFANHNVEKNSVFLVVRKTGRLYTLYYPAKNHNKMKNLINLL